MKENKMIFTVGGIILVALLLIVCANIDTKDSGSKVEKKEATEDKNAILTNAQTESKSVKDDEKRDFNNINTDTYLEYYKGEENKVVLIGRPTCHYCQIGEPILHKISKDEDVEINYLNTDEFSDDDQAKLVQSDSYFSEGFGTPLLLVVGNGKIVDKVDGLTDTAHYKEFLKKNNFIG